jgi:hypothetical protein
MQWYKIDCCLVRWWSRKEVQLQSPAVQTVYIFDLSCLCHQWMGVDRSWMFHRRYLAILAHFFCNGDMKQSKHLLGSVSVFKSLTIRNGSPISLTAYLSGKGVFTLSTMVTGTDKWPLSLSLSFWIVLIMLEVFYLFNNTEVAVTSSTNWCMLSKNLGANIINYGLFAVIYSTQLLCEQKITNYGKIHRNKQSFCTKKVRKNVLKCW